MREGGGARPVKGEEFSKFVCFADLMMW